MPESFGKDLCKEILLQFSPLLGHQEMDWGQSGQERGTSKDFFASPFPNPELLLSQIRFAWAHSGNLCQTKALHFCQNTTDPVGSHRQVVSGASWLWVRRWVLSAARGPGELSWNHQDAAPSQQEPPSHCWGCCPDGVQAEGWQSPGRAVPWWESSSVGMPKPTLPPSSCCASHTQTLGQDHWGLTLTCLYLHLQLFCCMCNRCNTFSDQFYRWKSSPCTAVQPLWCLLPPASLHPGPTLLQPQHSWTQSPRDHRKKPKAPVFYPEVLLKS